MCGIYGSPNITPQVTRMLPHLALAMEERGGDAWGASDGHAIIKHVGGISKTWYSENECMSHWDAGIFHTRGASVGRGDKVENAHPFRAEGENGKVVIGIHNGGCVNWQELNTKYSRQCQVDSEHLWLHYAQGLPWTDIRGSAAVAWWELLPMSDGGVSREMYICRVNSPSLALMRSEDGGLVFASTEHSLRSAARISGSLSNTFYDLKENSIYHLHNSGEAFELAERLEFGSLAARSFPASQQGIVTSLSHHPSYAWTQSARGGFTPHSSQSIQGCYKCMRTLKESSDLLCGSCFQTFIDRYKASQITTDIPVGSGISNTSELDDDDMEELMGMEYGC